MASNLTLLFGFSEFESDDEEIKVTAAALFLAEMLSELPVIRKLLTAPKE